MGTDTQQRAPRSAARPVLAPALASGKIRHVHPHAGLEARQAGAEADLVLDLVHVQGQLGATADGQRGVGDPHRDRNTGNVP
jgi:hypothetical protein